MERGKRKKSKKPSNVVQFRPRGQRYDNKKVINYPGKEYNQKKQPSKKQLSKTQPKSISRKLPSPDIWLIATIIGILIFGVVMVYSSSYYPSQQMYGHPYNFVFKQAAFAVMGVVGMMFVAFFIPYRLFLDVRVAGIIYLIVTGLALSLPFIGTTLNGATRWIDLGFITIQPSEFVKIGVILMISSYIVNYRKKAEEGTIKDHFWYVVIGLLIVGIPAAVVASENLSSGVVIAFCGMVILFISTPRIWYYFAMLGVVLVIGAGVYFAAINEEPTETTSEGGVIVKEYRMDRLRMWKDPWLDPIGDGYQTIQSLYAVGSGGLTGAGLGQSIQKLGYLPEPYNDIIFAVICEELGLIGAGLLLAAYCFLVLRSFHVALHTDDLFGSLVAIGLGSLVGVQAFFNAAVNTNTIPTTGMQLPLVSYGGTALVILLSSLGILLNISRYSNIRRIEV